MKKVFLTGVIAITVAGAPAQTRFGAQVGGNLANVKERSAYAGSPAWESQYDPAFGFMIGGVAKIPLSAHFAFRPELNFLQKGSKLRRTVPFYSYNGDLVMHFIEIPLNVVYASMPAGRDHLFFGGGPSVGFGISGKYNLNIIDAGNSRTEKGDVKFDGKRYEAQDPYNPTWHFKFLDVGATFLAGIDMANGMNISIAYAKGFSNLNPNANESFQTNGFQFKVGYMFGNKAGAKK
jgi:hypothetical protein